MEIIKGKRTKRLRPYSGGDAPCQPALSPKLESSNEKSVSTEEEEDTAYCLILLAQGFFPKNQREDNGHEEEEYTRSENKSKKIINKKILNKMDLVATGRTDYDIYECKACNRTFSSFQALGGHRTSHKKPGGDRKEDKQVKGEEANGHLSHFPPSHQIHFARIKDMKASKVHECSICGSEFSSGQALGGHMRRHRVAPVAKTASESEEEIFDHRASNILSFDLNLPAPIEDNKDQLLQSTFGFGSKIRLFFRVKP